MKKTEGNLIVLNIAFCVLVVVANVLASKIVTTGLTIFGNPITIPAAVVTYAMTFLCTDVVGEIWGKNEANKTVWRGFAFQLIASALIWVAIILPPLDKEMQRSVIKVLGATPIFTVFSLLGFICSQAWDVWIFHKIRDKFNGEPSLRWIWNNASTMTSQVIDTVIFIGGSFGIGLGWFWNGNAGLVFAMMIGQYCIKWILALFDTPFFYLMTHKKQ